MSRRCGELSARDRAGRRRASCRCACRRAGPRELRSLGDSFNAHDRASRRTRAERCAQAEREAAWRDVARKLAHEFKNTLTPMPAVAPAAAVRGRGGAGRDAARTMTRSLDAALREVDDSTRLADPVLAVRAPARAAARARRRALEPRPWRCRADADTASRPRPVADGRREPTAAVARAAQPAAQRLPRRVGARRRPIELAVGARRRSACVRGAAIAASGLAPRCAGDCSSPTSARSGVAAASGCRWCATSRTAARRRDPARGPRGRRRALARRDTPGAGPGPRGRLPADSSRRRRTITGGDHHERREPLNVLVVDDDAAVRARSRGVLEHAGHDDVEAAEPARRARGASRPRRRDVVLLDLAHARRARARRARCASASRRRDTAVIVVTGRGHGRRTPSRPASAARSISSRSRPDREHLLEVVARGGAVTRLRTRYRRARDGGAGPVGRRDDARHPRATSAGDRERCASRSGASRPPRAAC